jgi:hypothetical protein
MPTRDAALRLSMAAMASAPMGWSTLPSNHLSAPVPRYQLPSHPLKPSMGREISPRLALQTLEAYAWVFHRNGLAKFPVPHPVFGINDLRLGGMPYLVHNTVWDCFFCATSFRGNYAAFQPFDPLPDTRKPSTFWIRLEPVLVDFQRFNLRFQRRPRYAQLGRGPRRSKHTPAARS